MDNITEYDDPVALTWAVLTRIGAFEIQAVKVRSLESGLVHAVKYLDREGQQQLAFCILHQEEAGSWRCDRLTLALPYPQVPGSEEQPRFVLVIASYSPGLIIGGYVAGPHGSADKVRMIRLINAEGELVAEDSIEDELVIFTQKQASLGHTRVELRSAEGELLADYPFTDALRNRTSFTPGGVWAWPDPQQAVRQFLSSLSDSVREPVVARPESIQIVKELGNLDHCCYAVRYEDRQGQPRICFCGVTRWDSGLWLVTTVCWGRYFANDVEKLEQQLQQPWLLLWPISKLQEPPSLHGRRLGAPLQAGLVVDNGFHVARVRLLDTEGQLIMEDSVKDGMVLFMNERPRPQAMIVELYDHEGKLVGKHNESRQLLGKAHPPQGDYDSRQATIEFVSWLGASDIRISKTVRAGEKQWQAVSYTDLQGEQQRCLCCLAQQKTGHWFVSHARLQVEEEDDNPICVIETQKEKERYWASLYIADSTLNITRAWLLDNDGHHIIEDTVEDGFLLFTTSHPLQEPLRVQLETGTHTLIDQVPGRARWHHLAPRGPARPDPQQAIIEALIDMPLAQSISHWIVGMLLSGFIAAEDGIEMSKQVHIPRRRLYEVRYKEKLHGHPKRCFCLVGQGDSGLWLVTNIFWEGAITDYIERSKQEHAEDQPWLGRFGWFGGMAQPSSEHYLPLYIPFVMAGLVVNNGFEVTRVRLIDGKERELEDTVDDGLVLFLSEQPLQGPVEAELYDGAGRRVGQHRLY